ncbi:PREDICTED: pollen-specific leucine-rich repeat extensin-like protein 3 [Wasmannia auropunctata]|uniref:pollen-specific leucine-rich repeat extensin-like protein 3 n=1 Tax=Wasmannia auropunctata TaxID=64793 RepID=UPI0005EF43C3|nr:PREDICTED: pollen-specific leucine-rich repeat extensin-like protein 3 [Wasmannia auropunctata]
MSDILEGFVSAQLLQDLEVSDDDDGRAEDPGPTTGLDGTRTPEKSGPTTSPDTSNRRPVPRVGTYIQRGDAETQRRARFLVTPPPPRQPRPRCRPRPTAGPRRPAPAPAPKTIGRGESSRAVLAKAAATPPAAQGPSARRLHQLRPAPASSRPPIPPRPVTCHAVTTGPGIRAQPPPIRAPPVPAHRGAEAVRVPLPRREAALVPYSAVFRNRRYRAENAQGRWLIRFDHQGGIRAIRELPARGEAGA